MENRIVSLLPNLLGAQHLSTVLSVLREYKPLDVNEKNGGNESVLNLIRNIAQLGECVVHGLSNRYWETVTCGICRKVNE